MNVIRLEDGHVTIEIDIETGTKLYQSVNAHAVNMTNGTLELASLLQEAHYLASHSFRQPPHAFDAPIPSPPAPED